MRNRQIGGRIQLKIISRRKSLEMCAEAGWFAFDFLLDGRMDRDFILSLRPLGSFVFLSTLRQPFFKIETAHYILKGIQGADFFRMAVPGDCLQDVDRIVRYVNGAKPREPLSSVPPDGQP